MYKASEYGHDEVVKVLITAGADINIDNEVSFYIINCTDIATVATIMQIIYR